MILGIVLRFWFLYFRTKLLTDIFVDLVYEEISPHRRIDRMIV